MADVSEQVGLRNKLRARWLGLQQEARWGITIGVELLVSILLFLVDHSLGIGAALVFIVIWLRRLPAVPWRVLVEVGVVGAFAVASLVGSTPPSIAGFFAVVFLLSWIPEGRRRWGLPIIVLGLAVIYPFLVDKLFTIPVFGAFPDVATGTYMIVFMMMAVGLNIVVGYSGLLDLGYVAFYAIGAYTAGWFASSQFAGQKCPKPGFGLQNCPEALVPKLNFNLGGVGVPIGTGGFHFSIFLVLLIAGVITALFGIVIGLPTLRLRGDYLAIVTLGFGEILPQIARNGDSLGGFNLTNGANGITPIDTPGFGNHLSGWTGHFLPSNYLSCCSWTLNVGHIHHQVTGDDLFFWTALMLLVVTIFCSLRLRDSRLGRAWVAIREDETAAAAMGVPLMRTKTWAYASGAFFGGVAGAFYASQKSGTFPDDFYFNISVFVLCMVILGGMGNVWGVLRRCGLPRLPEQVRARQHRRLGERPRPHRQLPPEHRRAPVRLGDLRRDHRGRDALPARGAAAVEAARRRAARRRAARRPALRPPARGSVMAEDNVIVVEGLRKEFGGLIAVNDVDFVVPRGKVVSLIGPNGAGKTTFFNMLTGVYKPTAGRVTFLGEDVTGKPPHAITARGVGRTFQNIRLFTNMTTLENVLVGMHCRLKTNLFTAILRTGAVKREEAEARDRARELLRFAGLKRHEDESAGSLPYGDQRRLEVARALATEPQLLLLDEPDRRHEPAGVGRLHDLRAQAPRREQAHRADDRARHAGRDGHLRPRLGARLRPEDRRGHPAARSSRTSG